MKVEKIYPKEFAANSYIVTCDACEGLAVVVDPCLLYTSDAADDQ